MRVPSTLESVAPPADCVPESSWQSQEERGGPPGTGEGMGAVDSRGCALEHVGMVVDGHGCTDMALGGALVSMVVDEHGGSVCVGVGLSS